MAGVAALSEAKRNLLQSYLGAGSAQHRVAPSLITASSSSGPAPLTISQEQLIRREISRPDAPPLYNECIQLRMLGTLNVPALEKSFVDILRRHEIWRTTFGVTDGHILQLIHPPGDHVEMPTIDLGALPRSEQEEEIQRVIGELIQKRFDLSGGPLLQARLIRLTSLEHRLYVVAHLSIVDGVSVYQIFPAELAILYRAYAARRSPEFIPLPLQFRDYAVWQRQVAKTEVIDKQLNYWSAQLAGGIPHLEWPGNRARPDRESFGGKIEKFVLPSATAHAIKSIARKEALTLFATKVSLLAAVLHSYTGQDDFAIGTPSPSGRKRSEFQKLLGYFLTPVALRFRITSRMSFRELMRQAQRLVLEAISNDDLPVEVVAEKLMLNTDASRNPLFTVAMSLQPPMPTLELEWAVTSMDFSSGGAPWDLYLAFIDGQEGMLGRTQYNPDLFETETIARLVQDYQQLAQIVSANPERPLKEISIAS
jgi:hypothetical protein